MPPRVPVWIFPAVDDEETNMTQNILIVEDEVDLALGVRDALMHAGFRADVVHDGKVALEYLRKGSYDLLVLDLMLPGMNGLDLLRELRKERQDTRVLILTAMSSEEDLLEGFQAGADDYLAKPCSPRRARQRRARSRCGTFARARACVLAGQIPACRSADTHLRGKRAGVRE